MNSVNLVGRLTKDVELRYTGDQMAIATFSVAIDEGYGDRKRTNFIPIVVFGKRAENCEKFIGKGSLVGVEGSIRVESYENKEGKRVYSTKVVAREVHFLNSKPKTGESEPKYAEDDTQMDFEAVNESVPF